jgi:hypothetical protein
LIALARDFAQVARAMSQPDDKSSEREAEQKAESAAAPTTPARAHGRTRKGRAVPPRGSVPAGRVAFFVVLALAAGGAAGWFGHIEKAKAHVRAADAAPATSSSSGLTLGTCGKWREKICDSSGEASAACQQATAASDLLTPSTCEAALSTVPATLTRLKATRAACDTLMTKLCADLPAGSATCDMVKERTPAFPAKRCEEMLGGYDSVIEELRNMDKQGGPQLGQGGPGEPGGHEGHGH